MKKLATLCAVTAVAAGSLIASAPMADAAGARYVHNVSWSDAPINVYSGSHCTGGHQVVQRGWGAINKRSYRVNMKSTVHARGGKTYAVKKNACRSFSSQDVYVNAIR